MIWKRATCGISLQGFHTASKELARTDKSTYIFQGTLPGPIDDDDDRNALRPTSNRRFTHKAALEMFRAPRFEDFERARALPSPRRRA